MTTGPGATPEWRRRLGLAVLAAGAALVFATISRDAPREHSLVFRSDRSLEPGGRLSVGITRVGDAEASIGFTLELGPGNARSITHKVRLPSGDYIVAVALEGRDVATGRVEETSAEERVTLSGDEVVVPVLSRSSE